jgi:hypothetical protein
MSNAMGGCNPRWIEERRPVWQALSCLFIDTDTSLLIEHIAATLCASPYSLPELEEILFHEVYPVCQVNLLSAAGEWAGFDQAWLEGRILERLRSTRRLPRLGLRRIAICSTPEWQRTRGLIEARRSSAAIGSRQASGSQSPVPPRGPLE